MPPFNGGLVEIHHMISYTTPLLETFDRLIWHLRGEAAQLE